MLNADRGLRVVVDAGDRHYVEGRDGSICLLESFPEGGRTFFVTIPPGGQLLAEEPADREILVLAGEIEAGGRLWPKGSYLRLEESIAPPAVREEGAYLFVKSGRFPEEDRRSLGIIPSDDRWSPGLVEGLSVFPLFSGGTANTALVRWSPGTVFQPHRHFGGEEILVLSGVFEDEHGAYPEGTWYRAPHMSRHFPFSTGGCTIFVKTGHLLGASAA